jgi:hypothetical protein
MCYHTNCSPFRPYRLQPKTSEPRISRTLLSCPQRLDPVLHEHELRHVVSERAHHEESLIVGRDRVLLMPLIERVSVRRKQCFDAPRANDGVVRTSEMYASDLPSGDSAGCASVNFEARIRVAAVSAVARIANGWARRIRPGFANRSLALDGKVDRHRAGTVHAGKLACVDVTLPQLGFGRIRIRERVERQPSLARQSFPTFTSTGNPSFLNQSRTADSLVGFNDRCAAAARSQMALSVLAPSAVSDPSGTNRRSRPILMPQRGSKKLCRVTVCHLSNSRETYPTNSLVCLENSASRSMPHLFARTIIDHRQSDNSCPSLALQSSIFRTPASA